MIKRSHTFSRAPSFTTTVLYVTLSSGVSVWWMDGCGMWSKWILGAQMHRKKIKNQTNKHSYSFFWSFYKTILSPLVYLLWGSCVLRKCNNTVQHVRISPSLWVLGDWRIEENETYSSESCSFAVLRAHFDTKRLFFCVKHISAWPVFCYARGINIVISCYISMSLNSTIFTCCVRLQQSSMYLYSHIQSKMITQ